MKGNTRLNGQTALVEESGTLLVLESSHLQHTVYFAISDMLFLSFCMDHPMNLATHDSFVICTLLFMVPFVQSH